MKKYSLVKKGAALAVAADSECRKCGFGRFI